jgi:hypothetical protein
MVAMKPIEIFFLTITSLYLFSKNPWRYPDFMGVQGLLALSDTNPNTGGTFFSNK